MARRALLTIGMVLLVVLAGCSGGDGAEMTQTTAIQDEGPEASSAAPSDGDDVLSGIEESPAAADRFRIKRATYEVTVADFDTARTDLREAADRLGGYVGGDEFRIHTRNNVTWRTGTMVLRVPVERYGALIEAVEATGNVTEKSAKTVEVTGKVVDLRARLENLRAQRARLRSMYNQSTTTDGMLKIQERLSSVQSDIERLEGRLRTLQHDIAYSTVRVQLTERHQAGETEAATAWYDQGFLAAFLQSVDGAIVLARMIGVFVASAVPYLAVFGGIGAVGIGLVRVVPGTMGRLASVDRLRETDTADDEDEVE